MSVRYLFNSSGEYVAFVHSDNVFVPDGDWIGFIRNGNEFYHADGQFAGYILDDDRVARKRTDMRRPRLPRPPRPARPLRPSRPLRRLRMPRLPYPYEDLFIVGAKDASNAPDADPSLAELEGAQLYAADDTYLGIASQNQFQPESLANQFGVYGNQFNPNSVFNEFGPYGSSFSQLSPRNEFSRTPPRLVKAGKTVAYLTANEFISPRVDPLAFFSWIKVR